MDASNIREFMKKCICIVVIGEFKMMKGVGLSSPLF
jgi:hypothetical protein